MRALALALLVAFLLSGCTGGTEPATDPPADPPVEDAPVPSYDNAVWGSQTFTVTPATEGFFMVDIPVGARYAAAKLEPQAQVGSTLTIDLEGCGTVTVDEVILTNAGRTVELCSDPAPGKHRVTVTIDDGAFDGTVTVAGMQPAAA